MAESGARPRVAVLHQGFVPPYRRRFYELLDERSGFEYVVFHGDPPPGTGHRAAPGPYRFSNVRVQNRVISLGGRRLVHQPAVGDVARGGFAAVVLGAEVSLTANAMLFAVMSPRRRRPALLLWGQGQEKAEHGGRLRRAAAGTSRRVKRAAARRADGYLVYTEGGRTALVEGGVDPGLITVVRNTLDMSEQVALHERLASEDPELIRRGLGVRPDSALLVFLGRLYAEKHVDDLVPLAMRLRELTESPFEIAVLGDGPRLDPLRAAAAAVPELLVKGAVYDQEEVARWLASACAVVIPGKVGLAVNHAFAHELPVLTRESDLHAPEAEYVVHERNGLMQPGSFDAFAEAVGRFVDSPERQRELAAGAAATAAELSLARMVAAFDEGVTRAVQARTGRSATVRAT